jgi:hypothetical protein
MDTLSFGGGQQELVQVQVRELGTRNWKLENGK